MHFDEKVTHSIQISIPCVIKSLLFNPPFPFTAPSSAKYKYIDNT